LKNKLTKPSVFVFGLDEMPQIELIHGLAQLLGNFDGLYNDG
jgi:hypothetical protein